MARNLKSKWSGIAATVCALGALAAPAAHASILTTATSCAPDTLSNPFASFGDNSNYTPIPGGSFESDATDWSLAGGAKVVDGNESYNVNGNSDSQSLYIPRGGVATSPPTCVGLDHPTARWFSKSTGLFGAGLMNVTVIVHDKLGGTLELPVATALPSANWKPSSIAFILASQLTDPGQQTSVQFRFRPILGNWNIDDAYVDPYARS